MNIGKLLEQEAMDDSLILSFGGGGNYGDELLLEVLLNMFKQAGRTGVAVSYLQPKLYPIYHHDFGYPLVETKKPAQLLKAIIRSKNIVVGGGGLWGMDVNLSILIMSILLWVSRWLLGKKVYLFGVGYYNSTNRLGHIAAWLAAKAANTVIARDEETYANFRRFSANVSPGQDIAWHSRDINMQSYEAEANELERKLSLQPKTKTLFFTIRRFKLQRANNFITVVAECIKQNPDKQIIVALFEPRTVDPGGYRQLKLWATKHKHVVIIDFTFNPLALLLFFRRHHRQLVFIGPQFHGLITAHLSDVPMFPLVYDNKSQELLMQLGKLPTVSIYKLKTDDLLNFINTVEANG
jgi:polysaccharide pyruvyl transferase WcaK-like protein